MKKVFVGLGVWWVFLFVSSFFFEALAIEEVAVSGQPENRVDVVVLCEGYTASQQDKCRNDVNWFVTDMLNEEPFATYRNHYNFWLVPLVSQQSGADHPSRGQYVDTALDAYYDCNDIERLICIDRNKAIQAATNAMPNYDYITVLVNDTQYGGSGGEISVISINQYSPLIATHEFGHTHGDLADEYTTPYPGFPPGCPEPNVTCETERELIPWNVWIEPSTPIPTPEGFMYSDKVGLFEGARYQEHGIYRPQMSCMMRELGSSYCKVCREALALADYDYVNLIESTTPERNSEIHLDSSHTAQQITAQLVWPNGQHPLSISWTLNDGSELANGVDSITLTPSDFPSDGTYTLYLTVEDSSGTIRNDPMGKAIAFARWTVVVASSTVDGDDDDDVVDLPSEQDLPSDVDVELDELVDGDEPVDNDVVDLVDYDEAPDTLDDESDVVDAADEIVADGDSLEDVDSSDSIIDSITDTPADSTTDVSSDDVSEVVDSASISIQGGSSDSGCAANSGNLGILLAGFVFLFVRRMRMRSA